MTFQELHEALRLETYQRIQSGALSGARLAELTGFQQAHISNFLNRKRSLSLEGLDRVLAAQNLSVDFLMPLSFQASADQSEINSLTEKVPVVSSSAAMDLPRMSPADIIETMEVASSRLHENRPRSVTRHADWQRFLAIRADAYQAAAMEPLVVVGSILVIDRHYNSLAPYRAHQRTLYAVRSGTVLMLRYLEFSDGRLILRPASIESSVELIRLSTHETPADYIVGRVCLIQSEL